MNEKIFKNISNRKCNGPVYIVESGDTLYSIARKYHTRVKELLDLNPFVNIYNLQVGDEICVPSEETQNSLEFEPYVVKENETIHDIMQKYPNQSFDELLKINQVLHHLPIPQGTILLIPRKK